MDNMKENNNLGLEEMFKLMEEAEKKRMDNNVKVIGEIITELGVDILLDYETLLVDLTTVGELKIVTKPAGDTQNEKCGAFTNIWVDQWSVGDSGDSFEGNIYAKFGTDRWLKIPYTV